MAKLVSNEYNIYSASLPISTQVKSEMVNTRYIKPDNNKKAVSMQSYTKFLYDDQASTENRKKHVCFQEQE